MLRDTLVTVTAKCSVFLMFSVILQCSVFFMVTYSEVFSAPYGHCHSALFSAPYGHCHSAPYLRSAVVMNFPFPLWPHVKTMQQAVTPAISTQCCTEDPTVNVNCH